MPKKKSIKKCATAFRTDAQAIAAFLNAQLPTASKDHASWLHEYAIIRLYRSLESRILEALVGAVNSDNSALSANTGVKFPKHLTDEVCEYLLTGGGYFDFKGRDGLIKKVRRAVSPGHYLLAAVKQPKYAEALEQLSVLRNYAAHDSTFAKGRVKWLRAVAGG